MDFIKNLFENMNKTLIQTISMNKTFAQYSIQKTFA